MKKERFTAQLCRVKALKPTETYRKYLAEAKDDKTRQKELGEKMANCLSMDDGWEKLLGSLNKNEECVNQKVKFEFCDSEENHKRIIFEMLEELPPGIKFPEDSGNGIFYDSNKKHFVFEGIMSEEKKDILLNLSGDTKYKAAIKEIYQKTKNPIFYDSEKQIISFPKLKYNYYENKATLSIIINPCISESVRTKLIARPTFYCSTDHFTSSPQEVEDFFNNSISLTDALFDVIKRFYVERIREYVIKDVGAEPPPKETPTSKEEILSEYCKADIFVVGATDFKEWVRSSTNGNMESMVSAAEKLTSVCSGRKILQQLKRPTEEYKWFSRYRAGKDPIYDEELKAERIEYSEVNAVYGIHGARDYCRIIGIADNVPGLITKDLTRDLVSIIDRS